MSFLRLTAAPLSRCPPPLHHRRNRPGPERRCRRSARESGGVSIAVDPLLFGIAITAILVPAIYIASLIRQFGVNVPLWDDWDMVPMIVDAHEGDLRFADLFAQQLEARTLIPKLLFILFTFFGRFDARDGMMFSVLVCALTAAGAFVLLRRSGISLAAAAVCFVLIVLSIFSPAQEELWLLASGFPSFMPIAFILAGLLILQSRASTLVKFVTCAALSIASTFTLAHGLLAFGLTFPMLFAWERPRRWYLWLAAWCTLGAVVRGDLLLGLHEAAGSSAVRAARAVRSITCAMRLIFLGGGLVYGLRPAPDRLPLTAAATFGAILLVLFARGRVYILMQRRKDRNFCAAPCHGWSLGSTRSAARFPRHLAASASACNRRSILATSLSRCISRLR